MIKKSIAIFFAATGLAVSLTACGHAQDSAPTAPVTTSSSSTSATVSTESIEGSDLPGYSQKVVDLMVEKGWTVTRYIGDDANDKNVYVASFEGSTTCTGLRFTASEQNGTVQFRYTFGTDDLVNPIPPQLDRKTTNGHIEFC